MAPNHQLRSHHKTFAVVETVQRDTRKSASCLASTRANVLLKEVMVRPLISFLHNKITKKLTDLSCCMTSARTQGAAPHSSSGSSFIFSSPESHVYDLLRFMAAHPSRYHHTTHHFTPSRCCTDKTDFGTRCHRTEIFEFGMLTIF